MPSTVNYCKHIQNSQAALTNLGNLFLGPPLCRWISLGTINMKQDRGWVGRVFLLRWCIMVSTPLILGRAEACCSEGKLIISLCVLQFPCCCCENKSVNDFPVVASIRFHNKTEIKLSRVNWETSSCAKQSVGELQSCHGDICRFLNHYKTNKVCTLYMLWMCTSDRATMSFWRKVMKLHCCLHSSLIASRLRDGVSLSPPFSFCHTLSQQMSGAG